MLLSRTTPIDRKQWREWFAWRPVFAEGAPAQGYNRETPGGLIFFEVCERRYVPPVYSGCGPTVCNGEWHYRRIGARSFVKQGPKPVDPVLLEAIGEDMQRMRDKGKPTSCTCPDNPMGTHRDGCRFAGARDVGMPNFAERERCIALAVKTGIPCQPSLRTDRNGVPMCKKCGDGPCVGGPRIETGYNTSAEWLAGTMPNVETPRVVLETDMPEHLAQMCQHLGCRDKSFRMWGGRWLCREHWQDEARPFPGKATELLAKCSHPVQRSCGQCGGGPCPLCDS